MMEGFCPFVLLWGGGGSAPLILFLGGWLPPNPPPLAPPPVLRHILSHYLILPTADKLCKVICMQIPGKDQGFIRKDR